MTYIYVGGSVQDVYLQSRFVRFVYLPSCHFATLPPALSIYYPRMLLVETEELYTIATLPLFRTSNSSAPGEVCIIPFPVPFLRPDQVGYHPLSQICYFPFLYVMSEDSRGVSPRPFLLDTVYSLLFLEVLVQHVVRIRYDKDDARWLFQSCES